MLKRTAAAAVAAALALGAPGAAPADEIADFYAGKTITITIGYGFGGTYGKYARLFADAMSRHTPGNPNYIVKSMPGAGGLKAVEYAHNVMPTDGLHLLEPADTLVINQLMYPDRFDYDARAFTWLGSANQTNSIVVVRADSGVESVDEMKTKEVIFGTVQTGSASYLVPAALKALLGWKARMITGYKGSAKVTLAIEQGEVQAAAFNWLAWNSRVPHWFTDGFARAVVQLGAYRDPDLAEVPMAHDLVAAKDRPIIDFLATQGVIGRGLVTPPGVARDKVAALKAAFAKTLADPEFVATARKRRLRVIATDGADIQKFVDNALVNSDEAMVARARKLIFEK